MSNISLFKSGSIVPDYLREGSDSTTKDIAGASGGKQISIKGGVWRMIVGGEEVAKNEDRAMNLVVIAAGKGITRTYYADKYEEGKDVKPACWSAEGEKPNPEVPNPQASSCATCPQNIEGSGEGKSRACRYSKRLAVALENDITGNIYRMSVPAKSYFGKADGDKMPLQAFGKFLAGHGIPITGIVTEARFDTSEAVPVLKFRAVRPLTREEWEDAKAQSQTEEARQAIEFKMVPSKAETGNAPALPAAFKEPAAYQEPAPQAKVAEPVKRTTKKAEPAPATKDVSQAWPIGAATTMRKGLRGYSTPFVRALAEGQLSDLVAQFANHCVAREISVSAVAERIGVTRATVYSWFTGRSEPRARHQEKIRQILARWNRA